MVSGGRWKEVGGKKGEMFRDDSGHFKTERDIRNVRLNFLWRHQFYDVGERKGELFLIICLFMGFFKLFLLT